MLATPKSPLGFSGESMAGFRYPKTIQDTNPVAEPAIIPGGNIAVVAGTAAGEFAPMLLESAGLPATRYSKGYSFIC